MKLQYTVEVDEPCQLLGIGNLTPGEPVELTEYQLHMFEVHHHTKFGAGHFPPHVHVTVKVTEESEDTTDGGTE